MTLHTIGPETMAEDEKSIGRGYKSLYTVALALGPGLVWSIWGAEAAGAIIAAAALILLNECAARLHDLCIRVRRTNILLNSVRPPARTAYINDE